MIVSCGERLVFFSRTALLIVGMVDAAPTFAAILDSQNEMTRKPSAGLHVKFFGSSATQDSGPCQTQLVSEWEGGEWWPGLEASKQPSYPSG